MGQQITGGVVSAAALNQQTGQVHPSMFGFAAWSGAPETYGTSFTLVSGTLYTVVLDVPAMSITGVSWGLSTSSAAAGLTGAKYTLHAPGAAGALLGETADLSGGSVLTGTPNQAANADGWRNAALTTPYSHAGGLIRVGIWATGTTPPSCCRGGSAAPSNDTGAASTALRFAVGNTGLTTTSPNPVGTLTGDATKAQLCAVY